MKEESKLDIVAFFGNAFFLTIGLTFLATLTLGLSGAKTVPFWLESLAILSVIFAAVTSVLGIVWFYQNDPKMNCEKRMDEK